MEELGVPAQAKEAVAFALLAWLTWHGMPGNVPSGYGGEAAGGAGEGFVTDELPEEDQLRRICTALLPDAAQRGTGRVPMCEAARDEVVQVILESSPNNLDLRQGTDAQSERVGALIFDALVKKDERFELKPWLATSWEQPDPVTWVFHLRDGVRFQDGRPLEAADVVWTIESLIDPKLTEGASGRHADQHAKSGSFVHSRPRGGARPADGGGAHEAAGCWADVQHERWACSVWCRAEPRAGTSGWRRSSSGGRFGLSGARCRTRKLYWSALTAAGVTRRSTRQRGWQRDSARGDLPSCQTRLQARWSCRRARAISRATC